jgi:hypothetical protein
MEFNKSLIHSFEITNNAYDTNTYDIESVSILHNINNESQRENNINNINNKKRLLYIIIGTSFILSITYIIYIHNEFIYNSLKQIKNITKWF